MAAVGGAGGGGDDGAGGGPHAEEAVVGAGEDAGVFFVGRGVGGGCGEDVDSCDPVVVLEGGGEGGGNAGAEELQRQGCFGGEAGGDEVLGEGGAEECAVDEDVEWGGGGEIEHGGGVEDLREVVATDVCEKGLAWLYRSRGWQWFLPVGTRRTLLDSSSSNSFSSVTKWT